MLAPYPAKVRTLPILPDEAGAIASTLAGLAPCDVLATIGGASVGRHDLVRTALQDWGANLRFAGAAIKPGKPVFAAQKGRLAILGLPGNPVSAFVTAHLFLLPLVARLAGSAELFLRAEPGILAAPLPAGGERREFVRARATEQGLCPLLAGDSGALLPLSRATHLVDRPCSAPPAPAGTQVRAFPL
jgi:molybdopterin molybdotransferase